MAALKNKAVLGILAVAVLVIIGYFGWNYLNSASDAEKAAEEANALKAMVSKVMVLPEETPIVATVEQAETLRAEQPFYANVENGDKLMIFPQAAKAVIYREATGLIINSGPVQFQGQQTSQLTTPNPAQ